MMEISRNHKTRLSVSMQILEDTITDAEEIIGKDSHEKTMAETVNNLLPPERASILKRIEEIKELINYIALNLDLRKRKQEARSQILGAMTIQRVNLEEIKSKRLRGYGEVPDELREFLDPTVDKMMNLIDEICKTVGSTYKKTGT